MKKIITLLTTLFMVTALSAQTVAVWGIEDDICWFCNESITMSDLLIDELVHIDGIKVVERTRLNKVLQELNFQNSIYADTDTAKQIGKMVNADYVITGSVTIMECDLIFTARTIDVETGVIINSSKIKASSLNELNNRLYGLAKECVKGLYSTNIYLGTWSCYVGDDYYEITFNSDYTCSIYWEGETEKNGTGTYSVEEDPISGGQILTINGRFKATKERITWSSIVAFSGKKSFTMYAKSGERGGKKTTFTKIK